jgi:hypothetical protein
LREKDVVMPSLKCPKCEETVEVTADDLTVFKADKQQFKMDCPA